MAPSTGPHAKTRAGTNDERLFDGFAAGLGFAAGFGFVSAVAVVVAAGCSSVVADG